jgi:hypothetical protein
VICGISFFMTVSPRPRILSNVDVDDVAVARQPSLACQP